MKIVSTVNDVRSTVKEWKKNGLKVGLVPTMGFLHEGHLSLIKKAVAENDKVIVSVFVNPTQFGPNEDFEAYPRDLNKDAALCEEAGADLIFHPEPEEMYPDGFCSSVNMTGLTDALCGKSRPIHFQGVCTVVSKLFNIAAPDNAYFGEKDAQQLAIIKRMVKDLNFDMSKVNVNGGAIALGHPVGASGCRILVTLLHEMQKRDAKKGLATLCIGGGMGCATIVERD